jgi:excisionase family DNA binding protein
MNKQHHHRYHGHDVRDRGAASARPQGDQLDERLRSRGHEDAETHGTARERLLLTVPEAADELGLGRSLMYEMIASREIPSIKIGRLRRIPRQALAEYVSRKLLNEVGHQASHGAITRRE